jgi:hypothetical protein
LIKFDAGCRQGACPAAVFTVIVFLCTGPAAFAQRPSQSDGYAASIEQICRQYAAAQTGMPADLMFKQCMFERHCRVSAGSAGYQCERPGPLEWHGGGY